MAQINRNWMFQKVYSLFKWKTRSLFKFLSSNYSTAKCLFFPVCFLKKTFFFLLLLRYITTTKKWHNSIQHSCPNSLIQLNAWIAPLSRTSATAIPEIISIGKISIYTTLKRELKSVNRMEVSNRTIQHDTSHATFLNQLYNILSG